MKEWKKPELIVLSKSNAEEIVLGICKSTIISYGSNGYNSACQVTFRVCNPCNTVAAS